MLCYYSVQIFEASVAWRSTASLREERGGLKDAVAIYLITASIAVAITGVEAVLLWGKRRK